MWAANSLLIADKSLFRAGCALRGKKKQPRVHLSANLRFLSEKVTGNSDVGSEIDVTKAYFSIYRAIITLREIFSLKDCLIE